MPVEERLYTFFFEYGILGIAVIALVWYFLKREKDHKIEIEHRDALHEKRMELHARERDEWRAESSKQFEKLDLLQRETNQAMKDNTSSLASLKTRLETTREKK